MQGHVVIPNPWGATDITDSTTTTTTVDTTDKDGGDDAEPCGEGDPCDPETLGAGGRRNGLMDDDWFEQVKMSYSGHKKEGWKDMECNELKAERENYMSDWRSLQRLGFGGNCNDYNVWDDLDYLISISKLFTPSNALTYEKAYESQKPRQTIASLQVLDCLIAEKY
jgi:hypothetical protein